MTNHEPQSQTQNTHKSPAQETPTADFAAFDLPQFTNPEKIHSLNPTSSEILYLQRTIGNRATAQLLRRRNNTISIQRKKGDAEAYNAANKLGILEVTKGNVIAYVNDVTNPKMHRLGLLNAWNKNQITNHIIAAPADLGGIMPEALVYHSDSENEMDMGDLEDVRGEMSDFAQDEFRNQGVNLGDYREKTTRVDYPGGTGFTSSKVSNLISSPGFNTAQSEYRNVIPTLRGATGGDRETAQLMMKGLFDYPEFEKALATLPLNEKQSHQIRFFFSLLLNEILGRSTSNLLEIVAMLNNTIEANDDELLRRYDERGMFVPTAKEHKKIGGQQLSRIGHGKLDKAVLDAKLKSVLRSNTRLYHSLMEILGAKSPDDLVSMLKTIYTKFVTNVSTNVKITHK